MNNAKNNRGSTQKIAMEIVMIDYVPYDQELLVALCEHLLFILEHYHIDS